MNDKEQKLVELAQRRDELEAQLEALRADLRAAVASSQGDLPMPRIAELLGVTRQRAYQLLGAKPLS